MNIREMINRKRKGSVFAWMVVLFGMFFITIVYVFFSQIVASIIPDSRQQIIDMDPTNSTPTTVNILNTFVTIDTVWKYWPVLLFFGLVIWAIVYSTRQEPNYAG